ncbi:G-D-S-L family lipolytic protein [Aquimarina intermedia]|uniref:GDSL-like lipase/acylhydrolase family protein n=1 Tax=Aquimarina intermedia TaxID=350814 RepID=A0A5S5CCC6_9FLAO|nr:G-D-S-L family lipolytic protein [Aquimarina intermedia]TYP75986.1 GDSL-like lipase/acylhydrolase family protein [Aquimarina intermedia]
MMKNNIKYLAILALGIVACEPEFDNPIEESDVYVSGEADYSNYVALGNSLTAGYADASLYITGQENSYPNILAQQFEFAGGGEFKQPLMADNTGGLLLGGTQIQPNRLVLAFDAEGNPGPAVYTGGQASTDVSTTLTGPFNNLGAPGAKSFHLVAEGYGNVAGVAAGLANPYYARFASSANASIIGDAVSQNPTFFSLWIGNNDILGYATSGGVGVDHNETGNLDPTTYGSNDITNINVFGSVYSQLVAGLTANGAEGVVLNIPDVTSIPYFTTVPFAPLSPLDPNFGPQIPTLNETYAGLNQAFAFLGVPERSIVFSETAASAVVVKDENLTDLTAQLTQVLTPSFGPLAPILAAQFGQARQATSADLLVLTSSSIIGQVNTDRLAELVGLGLTEEMAGEFSVNGVTLPLTDQYVLTPEEQALVSSAQASFNATIKAIADANDLAFYDANAALSQIANGGIAYDGGVITSQFATGGAFSLDGVHPTPRAHAILANGILDVLKKKYKTNVPKVKAGTYGTVTVSNDVN